MNIRSRSAPIARLRVAQPSLVGVLRTREWRFPHDAQLLVALFLAAASLASLFGGLVWAAWARSVPPILVGLVCWALLRASYVVCLDQWARAPHPVPPRFVPAERAD